MAYSYSVKLFSHRTHLDSYPMYIHPTYRCTGEVITLPHSVNVFAPQQGFVLNQYVKVGDIVKKGQKLYEIDISRNTTNGNVSLAQTAVINEKIINAESIITKLIRNKDETLNALDTQLNTIKNLLAKQPQCLPTRRQG